jgi:lipoyl-dependent peroxiredoxin
MIRNAVAIWKGSPLTGEGLVTTSSGILSNALYSGGEGTGNEPCTSPSEMLVAAVGSCMSLMVVQELRREGMKPELVRTESALRLEDKKTHWEIAEIDLTVNVTLPGGNEKKVQHAIKLAKGKCPISSALNCPIKVKAELNLEHPVGATA